MERAYESLRETHQHVLDVLRQLGDNEDHIRQLELKFSELQTCNLALVQQSMQDRMEQQYLHNQLQNAVQEKRQTELRSDDVQSQLRSASEADRAELDKLTREFASQEQTLNKAQQDLEIARMRMEQQDREFREMTARLTEMERERSEFLQKWGEDMIAGDRRVREAQDQLLMFSTDLTESQRMMTELRNTVVRLESLAMRSAGRQRRQSDESQASLQRELHETKRALAIANGRIRGLENTSSARRHN